VKSLVASLTTGAYVRLNRLQIPEQVGFLGVEVVAGDDAFVSQRR
jgi:hypothetical protein